MATLAKRIENLEQAKGINNRPWLSIDCEPDETPEQAANRQGVEFDQNKYNYIIRTIVDPGDKRRWSCGVSGDDR